MADLITDAMVLKTQQWLNKTYEGKTGYGSRIPESGFTGWTTIYALTRALQIELGITSTANNFGPSTISKFNARFPNGIQQQSISDETESNIYAIIQGACWCKGYSTGAGDITKHFYSGTGSAINQLKTDAGCVDKSSTVTLNVMKALLSMDQFKKVNGGDTTIRQIQKKMNNKYEDYIGLIPCDGVYGRQMNKALIIALQKIEGYSKEDATGNFGAGTKSKLPIVPTLGQISEQTEKEAIELVRYALCCNGYLVDIESNAWTVNLNSTLGDFQKDMCIEVTGICDTNTWMALLLSKGNPDRDCNACDTVYNMRDDRLDALKSKSISVIGRYIVGGNLKETDNEELSRIMNKGFKFFPIYQVNGTPGIEQFTTAKAMENARIARIKAKSFRIPEDSIIYFAVDFDAVDTQIQDTIIPYFKTIKENIGCYRVGVYGTRNVCTQVMNKGYAVTCFVSDMSTGYSGNMGFKMPKNWNFDQYNEVMLSAASGNFGIDKVTYSGKYPVVENLTNDIGTRGHIGDISFVSTHTGDERPFAGNKMRVYVSATKLSENIPDDAKLLVRINPVASTRPLVIHSRELLANLDGKIYELDSPNYMNIGDGYSIQCEYRVVKEVEEEGEDETGSGLIITKKYILIPDAEVSVHIEFETEY